MRTALYAGSFNPWHDGHSDVLRKALKIFDKVLVSVGKNPDKATWNYNLDKLASDFNAELKADTIENYHFEGLLVHFIEKLGREGIRIDALVRGLRGFKDLQYETEQQYWNEDLGLKIPIVYFITDRKLAHISSSNIRFVESCGVHVIDR